MCRQTKAIFVSFNADLQLFTQSIITFSFTDGGSIMVRQPGCILTRHQSCSPHQHSPVGSSVAATSQLSAQQHSCHYSRC